MLMIILNFYSPTIYGKITQKEFMLKELEANNQTTKDFCMRVYPKYLRYIQTGNFDKLSLETINNSTNMFKKNSL